MAEKVRFHAVVTGRVQGIGYRWFVQRAGSKLGLGGWVRNRDDGSVEVDAEAPSQGTAEQFLDALRHGHPSARVQDIAVDWLGSGEAGYAEFAIRF